MGLEFQASTLWDDGKENGNYHIIQGFIWGDSGKENGKYYVIMGYIWGIY